MMQNSLFLHHLIIYTEQGKVAYDQVFHKGVNIIRGQNSSGKSTIIRFIFFVLGGCYNDFVPEALKCKMVVAEVEANGHKLLLKRYLERRKDGRVNGKAPLYIYFGSMQDFKNDSHPMFERWQKFGYDTTNSTRSFSNVLFEVMGLPEMKADSNITMYQILRLIYLDQESPLSSLYFFDPWDNQFTRDTVAELLMGLYNLDLSQAKLDRISLGKRIAELEQSIKITAKHLPKTASLSPAFIQQLIDNKKKEVEEVAVKIQSLREGEVLQEVQLLEYQRMQEQIKTLRQQCVALDDAITSLKAEIQDSTYFIHSLEKKIEAVDRSIATRDYFDSLHLEYCPECLTELDDNVEEGHCRLCKSPIDNTKGKSQAQRIKLELDFQKRESQQVLGQNKAQLKQKEAELEKLQREVEQAQQEYDYAVRNVRSTRDEEIDKYIQDMGYLKGEITQFLTMMETAKAYQDMVDECTQLKAEDAHLSQYIAEMDRMIENRRVLVERAIKYNGIYLLKHDQDRQEEFRNARDFKMDYAQNIVYLSDRQIKLSASSAFYLKMAARFALFLSSVQQSEMMYPRLMLSDNMEDKGMEEERAKNFQRILVKRLEEIGNPEYQVIFATSNIAPELDIEQYTIGESYSESSKSLKNV